MTNRKKKSVSLVCLSHSCALRGCLSQLAKHNAEYPVGTQHIPKVHFFSVMLNSLQYSF